MNILKRFANIFFSMRFAIILLLLLVVACIIGSVIPQEEVESVYLEDYPSFGYMILALNLDDVFHSVWFAAITAVLCLNLLGCNLIRFPGIMKEVRAGYTAEKRNALILESCCFETDEEPDVLFSGMHFRNIQRSSPKNGPQILYAVRNRFGIFGAWLTHFGMLILIVGFALGQIYAETEAVYGVPGQTKQVGTTDYALTINSFDVLLREDDTVEQYISNLTLTDTKTGESVTGDSSVNYPLSAFGYEMYQNATGYAADCLIFENGELLQDDVLCVGEYTEVEDLTDLKVALRGLYPDYTVDESGMPTTASDEMNNPAYLYILYYKDELLGMNVLQSDEKITVDDYEIVFMNPQMYTLIQFKHDPYQGVALAGGIVILLALMLSFCCRTEELWAVRSGGRWQIGGYSKKGGALYLDKLRSAVTAIGGRDLKPEEEESDGYLS